MKKFLFALLLPLLSAALFAQQEGEEGIELEYSFSSETVESLWKEWESEREEGKLLTLFFLHSLPIEIVTEVDNEELSFFYALLLDDVSLFNDIIYTPDINISIDLIERKIFSALITLPLRDEDKLKSMKMLELFKSN